MKGASLMNYQMPYYNYMPYGYMPKQGIISSLFGGIKRINWGGIISGTQKTLSVVNQAIPAIKQVSPILRNAKTMFRVMSEFKKAGKSTPNSVKSENTAQSQNKEENKAKPTFFL
jgi:hypothetical protein